MWQTYTMRRKREEYMEMYNYVSVCFHCNRKIFQSKQSKLWYVLNFSLVDGKLNLLHTNSCTFHGWHDPSPSYTRPIKEEED